jgi:hypothetical protein
VNNSKKAGAGAGGAASKYLEISKELVAGESAVRRGQCEFIYELWEIYTVCSAALRRRWGPWRVVGRGQEEAQQ